MSLDVAAIFAIYDPYPATRGIRVARVDRNTGAVTTAGPFPNAWQMARVTALGLDTDVRDIRDTVEQPTNSIHFLVDLLK